MGVCVCAACVVHCRSCFGGKSVLPERMYLMRGRPEPAQSAVGSTMAHTNLHAACVIFMHVSARRSPPIIPSVHTYTARSVTPTVNPTERRRPLGHAQARAASAAGERRASGPSEARWRRRERACQSWSIAKVMTCSPAEVMKPT